MIMLYINSKSLSPFIIEILFIFLILYFTIFICFMTNSLYLLRGIFWRMGKFTFRNIKKRCWRKSTDV